jgi:anti-sigma factor RsiW
LSLFSRRALTCEEVVRLVTDYLEGALSRTDRRRFKAHLSGCPHCTEFLAQMRSTIAVTRRLTVQDMSPEFQRDFVAMFRQWKVETE